jgi:hypothetical protein
MALASSKARRFATAFKALYVGPFLRKQDTETDFTVAAATLTRLDAGTVSLPSPGAVASGLSIEVSVTVPDAAVGDLVALCAPVVLEAGLIIGAVRVTAANTITFRIVNATVGSITPATATYSYFLARTAA